MPILTPIAFMFKKQVVVIGDSEASSDELDAAYALGKLLASMNVVVVTGGRGGVMEAVSRGVREAGGLSVGILPGEDFREANPFCDVIIPTGMGHARNAITAMAGHAVVGIGGGAGTLSELALASIYGRPVFVLTGHGGWSDRLAGTVIDPKYGGKITACKDLDELKRHLDRILNG